MTSKSRIKVSKTKNIYTGFDVQVQELQRERAEAAAALNVAQQLRERLVLPLRQMQVHLRKAEAEAAELSAQAGPVAAGNLAATEKELSTAEALQRTLEARREEAMAQRSHLQEASFAGRSRLVL